VIKQRIAYPGYAMSGHIVYKVVETMVQAPVKITRRSQADRSAATISRLIEATISALHEFGYSATSTALVAKRAGVSRGAMLHHYPTKVHLMAATAYAVYERDIAQYGESLSQSGKAPDRLDRLIDTAWECFKSPAGIAQTEIWMATRSDAELGAVVLPVHAAIAKESVERLKGLLGDKLIDPNTKLEQILAYLVGSLRGLALEKMLGALPCELDLSVTFIKRTIRSLLK
jgi:AcrR family transcriptional regulator